MNFTLLLQYVDVVFREMWRRKFLCIFGFAAISFVVLAIGSFWPSKFEAYATIFADNQNILKPLLEKKAQQKKVTNQTKVVREMMQSPRILKKVVEIVYGIENIESAEELGAKINRLRKNVSVRELGTSYMKISYQGESSNETYRVINAVVDVFIKTSADEQRAESREAFLFIDNQVKQYKGQLVLAEERLKEFRSINFDGRDTDVDNSISRLRAQIEELKINLDEDRITINVLKKQLNVESEYTSSQFKSDVYGERLAALETQRRVLLMTYTQDYPDVISLTYQINDIKDTIKDAAKLKIDTKKKSTKNVTDENSILNPLYQELRSRLSLIQSDMKAKENRLKAFSKLKGNEFERRKRIAARGAEESELTRDYDVTKRIYEDMLERKETARLSMTLNIEGQGVTYRIQEPALPPLSPIGLRSLHFVIVGPFVGLFAILGLVIVYILLDPRIRFASRLSELGVPVLAVIPHVKTPFTKRVVRVDMIVCLVLACLIMAAYIGLAFAIKMGLI
jgi:polysaccharide chain length determinant protein (PEP-CTERM system associated)